MTREEKYNQLKEVLGTSFSINLLANIEYDWHEFYTNTEKYRNNAIVVDMVNLYLDELDDGIDCEDDYTLGYESNCHCDTYGVCGGYSCRNYAVCHSN